MNLGTLYYVSDLIPQIREALFILIVVLVVLSIFVLIRWGMVRDSLSLNSNKKDHPSLEELSKSLIKSIKKISFIAFSILFFAIFLTAALF